MYPFNHPLINENAGRIKSDATNQHRIAKVISRYEHWAGKVGKIDALKYTITKTEVERSKIIFPLAGFAIGYLGSYFFVHPKSQFIGKFFIFFTTVLGYKAHLEYQRSYYSSRYFGNFWHYPLEIRRMIDNNDARYAWKWLKPDWETLIQPSVQQQVESEIQAIQSAFVFEITPDLSELSAEIERNVAEAVQKAHENED